MRRVSAAELERLVDPMMKAIGARFKRRFHQPLRLVLGDTSSIDVGPPHKVLYEPPLKVTYQWLLPDPPQDIIALWFDNAARPAPVPDCMGKLEINWVNEITICGNL